MQRPTYPEGDPMPLDIEDLWRRSEDHLISLAEKNDVGPIPGTGRRKAWN